MIDNPYAPPTANLDTAPTEATEIRTAHLSHEASIKGVGLLYFIGGGGMLLGGLVTLLIGISDDRDPVKALLVSALLLGLGAGGVYLGYGLRRLKPWVRIPVGIFSALGLINFPIGTLLNLYILYLIFSRKGRTILTAEYADVVARTPEIRYRTSIVVRILLALLLLLLLAFAVAFAGPV